MSNENFNSPTEIRPESRYVPLTPQSLQAALKKAEDGWARWITVVHNPTTTNPNVDVYITPNENNEIWPVSEDESIQIGKVSEERWAFIEQLVFGWRRHIVEHTIHIGFRAYTGRIIYTLPGNEEPGIFDYGGKLAQEAEAVRRHPELFVQRLLVDIPPRLQQAKEINPVVEAFAKVGALCKPLIQVYGEDEPTTYAGYVKREVNKLPSNVLSTGNRVGLSRLELDEILQYARLELLDQIRAGHVQMKEEELDDAFKVEGKY